MLKINGLTARTRNKLLAVAKQIQDDMTVPSNALVSFTTYLCLIHDPTKT